MASETSKALDSLTLSELMESYKTRFPGWAVPPVLNPSAESRQDRPLRQQLLLALASGQPVVEWEKVYGNPPPALEF
jgi:hypothetical protein